VIVKSGLGVTICAWVVIRGVSASRLNKAHAAQRKSVFMVYLSSRESAGFSRARLDFSAS
jgi:hypothetical protein